MIDQISQVRNKNFRQVYHFDPVLFEILLTQWFNRNLHHLGLQIVSDVVGFLMCHLIEYQTLEALLLFFFTLDQILLELYPVLLYLLVFDAYVKLFGHLVEFQVVDFGGHFQLSFG